jgi:hypothetical protein
MKTIICIAAGFMAAAVFGSAAYASGAQQERDKPAARLQAQEPASKPSSVHHRRARAAYSHWCAYNCYAIPRHHTDRVLGRYGYSRYAYDEDLPANYSYDPGASPVDNVGAFISGFTGTPVMRAMDRSRR